MGQRANLIVVEGGDYQLFYGHWCANTLPRDLFWGPEHALAFIRIQRPVDDWLDDVWAEGGALLDLDRNHFLLYGGEDVLHDVPLRRVYLALLAKVWGGWTVRWAHEGIAALADYVRYPRGKVLTKPDSEFAACTLSPPEQKDWTDLVASVRFHDGTMRLFPLAGDLPCYLSGGPKLTENIQSEGLDWLFLDEWTNEFPAGGFHMDLSVLRLDFWVARDAPDILSRTEQAWAGWQVCWHCDRYEAQLERTAGVLRFPLPERQALLERCRQMLLREPTTSPAHTVKEMAERERAEGKDVQVNPWALRDDRLELPMERRIAILTNACARL
jgi:hypothetical protein